MVAKTKAKAKDAMGMTKAPWIYVSDGSLGQNIVKGLLDLIPDATSCRIDAFRGTTATVKHPLIIIERTNTVLEFEKVKNARAIRTAAISRGCNFASVNFTGVSAEFVKNDQWGTNHIDISAGPDAAAKVYKWLCKYIDHQVRLNLTPVQSLF